MDWKPKEERHETIRNTFCKNIHPTAIVSNMNRFRHIEMLKVGAHSIIDDFSYFSTRLTVGINCHLASHLILSGGDERHVRIGDHSVLSSRVGLFCSNANFPDQSAALWETKDHPGGDITIGEFCIIGAASSICAPFDLPEGTCLGMGSRVLPNQTYKLDPWSIYVWSSDHNRLLKVRERDEEKVRAYAERYENDQSIGAG